MTKTYNFARQRGLGKWGESQAVDFIKRMKETVDIVDVAENKELRPHGVDFIWLRKKGEEVKSCMIDVKMDMLLHRTGNVFIETTSNKENNKSGNLLTSQADLFVYYDPFGKQLFFFKVEWMKKWFLENEEEIREAGTYMKTVKNKTYTSEGFVIHPGMLCAFGFGYRVPMVDDGLALIVEV